MTIEDHHVRGPHGEGLVAAGDQPRGIDRPLKHRWRRRRDVDVYELPLEEYVDGLAQHVGLETSVVRA